MHFLSGVLASAPAFPIAPISKGNAVRGRGIRVDSVRRTPRREVFGVLRCLAPALVSAILTLSPAVHPPVFIESQAQMANIQRGADLFRRACIGCHDAGGNIIQPGATLFINDLRRYGVIKKETSNLYSYIKRGTGLGNGIDSEEGIYGITYYGKGRMPGFGENCTPRGQCTFGPRLQEEEIRELARFVKLQADHGWPNIEMGQD